MKLESAQLFSGRDFFGFFLLCALIAFFSLLFEYFSYSELVRFDDAVVDAEVVHQYVKTKDAKRYHVLKMRSDDGASFYTTAPGHLRNLQGYRVRMRIHSDRLTYLEYLKGFFVFSTIERVHPQRSVKMKLADTIASLHASERIGRIYAALFTASPMDKELRSVLSSLGISHLLAISGFHLGVLGFILYWLLKPPYAAMQGRRFPYRHGRRDLFIVTAAVLFAYVWFLDYVPSLVRAFGMMVVGYLLYDRGVRLFSMQSLLVVVMLLVSLWPRLFFSVGFWLSVCGVFFILLFMLHFSHRGRLWQFVAVHVWVYLMMLPVALYLFETFSPYHPLSIVWTMLFLLFYPMALALHLAGFGHGFDAPLLMLLESGTPWKVSLPGLVVLLHFALALAAIRFRTALWLLGVVTLAVFVRAVYQVA